MRVTTANQFSSTVAELQRRQQQMQTTQLQLTTGKKVANASDDPIGASRVERALAAINRVEANQRALAASRNSMNLAEAAIGDASEVLQQVREALVSAGNASYGDSERVGLANKISGLRAQLLAIANRPDGAGGYVFSGQGASQPPFLDEATGVRFNGVPGNLQTGSLDDFALTVDGRQTWQQGRTGNGSFVTAPQPNTLTGAPPTSWIDPGRVTDPQALTGDSYSILIEGTVGLARATITNVTTGVVVAQDMPYEIGKAISFDGMTMTLSGTVTDGDLFTIEPATNDLNVFNVLDKTIADLRTPLRSGVQIQQANILGLRDLDQAFGALQNVRSLVGERLNLLDGSETRLDGLKLYNQTERSAAEDLDMTEAISRFEIQKVSYDAALRSYAAVQRLNLFEYLNF
jgi:flagellar hook-associated protein 3 FlgL